MSAPGLDRELGENFSLFFSLGFFALGIFGHSCSLFFRGISSSRINQLDWPAMYARVSLNRNPEPYPDHRIIGNLNLNSNRVSGDKILSYPCPPRSSI